MRLALASLWAAGPAGPPLDRRARLRALARHHLLPLALYALIAALMTFPLILHLATHVPGDGGDALMNYWGYWWVRQALAAGEDPFRTPLLYAPYGAPLYLHTLNLFNGLVSIPVQLAFGMTAAYNAVVFLSFALAGYFAYLLVAHISGSRVAGFLGGAIYAFGSYHLTHLLGHTNLLSSEWLPAYALCLVAANEATGRRRTLLVAAGSGALFLLALTDWQYVLFAITLTLVYACYTAVARRSATPLLVGAAIGALWGLAALPLVVPTFAEVRSGAAALPVRRDLITYSADLLSFVVPSPLHPWWGSWAAGVHARLRVPPVEGAVFLGYLPLALALAGGWWARRRARVWLVAAAVAFLLALGPYLHVGGVWQFGRSGWSVPLPYQALERLPGVSVMRTPVRFSLALTLCVAVLAGCGLREIAPRWAWARESRARLVLVPVLLAALLAEHLAAPYPLEAVSSPPFYQRLAASSEAGTILEWPFSLKRARSDYYQTVHGRPIVGGYISRRLYYPIASLPPFSNPSDIESDIVAQPVPDGLGSWVLAYAGVRWIVVYLDDPRLNRAELPAFLQRYAAPAPLYQDERMVVYRPLPPGGPVSFISLSGGGWYDPERLSDQRTALRWFESSADLAAWNFGAAPQVYSLRFDAWSFHLPRRLQVVVDGQPLGPWLV
ncbi:MAG TPA: hypothetical protein VF310_06525, partial [Vicinamibacteria bacterium]